MIGIFDSGVGGLNIFQAIRQSLPQADLAYLADNKNVPYGTKSPAAIRHLARAATAFLEERGARLVVVACNTATTAAIAALRENFNIPFVGVVPAVKVAAKRLRSRRIGVICTPMTALSQAFNKLVAENCQGAKVWVESCPLLVRQIEQGQTDTPATRAILHKHLDSLVLRHKINTVVLGSTHFAFVSHLIKKDFPQLQVVDNVPAIARQTQRLAATQHLDLGQGRLEFWATGDALKIDAFRARLGLPLNPPSRVV